LVDTFYQGNPAQYSDTGTASDPDITPPDLRPLFDSEDNYPGAVCLYQQRLALGGSNDEPETVYCSQTGYKYNFSIPVPNTDAGPATFSLVGQRVNQIKHLLDAGKLLIFTSGAEHAAGGDTAGVLTPTSINQRAYTYHGCSDLRPLMIGGDPIFVQARGSIIRDVQYQNEVQGYRGNDLTVFSSHLVDGYELVDWAERARRRDVAGTHLPARAPDRGLEPA
jgi:hypothetical protein